MKASIVVTPYEVGAHPSQEQEIVNDRKRLHGGIDRLTSSLAEEIAAETVTSDTLSPAP
jgi:hypothetical protein